MRRKRGLNVKVLQDFSDSFEIDAMFVEGMDGLCYRFGSGRLRRTLLSAFSIDPNDLLLFGFVDQVKEVRVRLQQHFDRVEIQATNVFLDLLSQLNVIFVSDTFTTLTERLDERQHFGTVLLLDNAP